MRIEGYSIGECVSQHTRTLVYRATRDGDHKPVIIKSLPPDRATPREAAILRRELTLLQKCDPAFVVAPIALMEADTALCLIMEDFGGRSLAAYTRPERLLPLDRFLCLAIGAARAIESIHSRDIIHKDISPGNLIFNPDTAEVKLIDFGIASEQKRESGEANATGLLAGTLPYISPEQTGRMNCDLDYRTDFYSLGATLFELLTGRPLFQTEDDIGTIHAHIASEPERADRINPKVPAVIADIVMKLLAKSADDRYQSSAGLLWDLEECQNRLQTRGAIEPFPIGQHDVSERFKVPQKLYGREEEVLRLKGFLAEVNDEKSVFVMIQGPSGIGKSALVHELYKPMVGRAGFFVRGRCDPLMRARPFGALSQAFSELTEQILSMEKDLGYWRFRLQTALGDNGALVTALAPRLELILGPLAPPQELPPTESLIRLKNTLLDFLGAIAQKENSLLLFLDDLQWSDDATLGLLADLAQYARHGNLLLIGAFRDKELEGGHPLTRCLVEMGKHRPVHELTLMPLCARAIDQLLADTLQRPIEEIAQLSSLLVQKTAGNPHFTREFLTKLFDEKLIWFDHRQPGWSWNKDRIASVEVAGNVVELMLEKLNRLPAETTRALAWAAHIGHEFDLGLLGRMLVQKTPEVLSALAPAIESDLVTPLDDSYRYLLFGDQNATAGAAEQRSSFRFQHDQILGAARAMVNPDVSREYHLRLARALIQDNPPAGRELEIAQHYNAALPLITDQAERGRVTLLDLRMAKNAKHAGAYSSAQELVSAGISLLGDQPLSARYEQAFPVLMEGSEIAYLSGQFERAEAIAEDLLAHAKSDLDRVKILHMQAIQYQTGGNLEESLDKGLSALACLEQKKTPKHPGLLRIVAELARTKWSLAGKRIQDLDKMRSITDVRLRLTLRVLMDLVGSAYLTANRNLSALLVFKAVNLTVRHGLSPETAYVFMCYSTALTNAVGDLKSGKQFADLAIELMKRNQDVVWRAKSLLLNAVFLRVWHYSQKDMISHFLNAIGPARQAGDMISLGGSSVNLGRHSVESGLEIDDKVRALVQETSSPSFIESLKMDLALVDNYRGLLPGEDSLGGKDFDEDRYRETMRRTSYLAGLCTYHIEKARLLYHNEDYEPALLAIQEAGKLLDGLLGNFNEVFFRITKILVYAALYPEMAFLKRLTAYCQLRWEYRKIRAWSEHNPQNFLHLRHLAEAELARIGKRPILEVIAHYDLAIENSRGLSPRIEAQANHRALCYLVSQQAYRLAYPYYHGAMQAYSRWGASRLVSRLRAIYATAIESSSPFADPQGSFPAEKTPHSQSRDVSTTASSTERDSGAIIDLASVLKASQGISGEIELQPLLTKLMNLLIENAGAEAGILILAKEQELWVEAQITLGTRDNPRLEPIPLDRFAELAQGVIRYVHRTKEPVVLSNACEKGQFISDAYVQRTQARSILCAPIQRHDNLIGLIYLENHKVSAAFTPTRVEVLRVLAAQAAISIENARLYNRLKTSTNEIIESKRLLEIALEQAQASNRAKRDFLARTSHELRTPLNSIINLPQGLLDNLTEREVAHCSACGRLFELEAGERLEASTACPGCSVRGQIHPKVHTQYTGDLGEVAHNLRNVIKSGRHLLGVINDILDISHLESGRMHLLLDTVDLVEILDEVVASMRAQSDERGITISVEHREPSLLIKADRVRLVQILGNLLSNALKFSPPSGRVEVGLDQDEKAINLSVRDHGLGINPKDQERIFEGFFQADGGSTRKHGGTGLGLAITKSLVELHGGQISLSSAPGQGSTFLICLPRRGGGS